MGSVSGDAVAPEHAEALADLALAMEGGEGFSKRLATLEKIKRDNRTAFEQLKIAGDVRAALDDAQRVRDEAVKVRTDAEKAAAQHIADARQDAESVRAAAAKYAAEQRADAKAKADEADAYYARRASEANAVVSDAAGRMDEANKAAKNAQAEAAKWQSANTALEASKQQHAKAQEVLKTRVATLNAALASVSKG